MLRPHVRYAPLALLLCLACSNEATGPGDCPGLTSSARNVVLVVGDTLRKDRIGAYGGPAATPNLDRFAASGLRYEVASAPAPWTKPSIATLFTGRQPWEHGVLLHPAGHDRAGEATRRKLAAADVLPEAFDTLAEQYRAAGYATAAFVANPWLEARFGFAQGFEVYEAGFARWDAPGALVSAAASRWLSERSDDRPFFLYVHYLDPHRPYPALDARELREELPRLNADARPLAAANAVTIQALVEVEGVQQWHRAGIRPTRALLEHAYDRGVEQFDSALGHLLDGLSRTTAGEDTLVIVTSDHGEALYERGYGNHGNGLYEEELAIPLAVAGPGVPAAVPACPVGLHDLMPTLCELSGLSCPEDLPGRSLAAEGPATERILVSGGMMERTANRAARDGRFKLLYQPDGSDVAERRDAAPAAAERRDGPLYALFDLREDPGEVRDLHADGALDPALAPVFERLRAAAEAAEDAPRVPRPAPVPVDAELQDRLEALGYLE